MSDEEHELSVDYIGDESIGYTMYRTVVTKHSFGITLFVFESEAHRGKDGLLHAEDWEVSQSFMLSTHEVGKLLDWLEEPVRKSKGADGGE